MQSYHHFPGPDQLFPGPDHDIEIAANYFQSFHNTSQVFVFLVQTSVCKWIQSSYHGLDQENAGLDQGNTNTWTHDVLKVSGCDLHIMVWTRKKLVWTKKMLVWTREIQILGLTMC